MGAFVMGFGAGFGLRDKPQIHPEMPKRSAAKSVILWDVALRAPENGLGMALCALGSCPQRSISIPRWSKVTALQTAGTPAPAGAIADRGDTSIVGSSPRSTVTSPSSFVTPA